MARPWYRLSNPNVSRLLSMSRTLEQTTDLPHLVTVREWQRRPFAVNQILFDPTSRTTMKKRLNVVRKGWTAVGPDNDLKFRCVRVYRVEFQVLSFFPSLKSDWHLLEGRCRFGGGLHAPLIVT